MCESSLGENSASWSEVPDGEAETRLQHLRDSLVEARLASFGKDGAFLDRSGTGSGKTHACVQAAAAQLPAKSLVAVRTHREAAELVRTFRHGRGLPVVAYPMRAFQPIEKPVVCPYCGIDPPGPPESHCCHCRGTGSIINHRTCWNPDADLAEAGGLSVTAAVCPDCPFRAQCEQEGYLSLTLRASEAEIAIATHARLQYRGFAEVAAHRGYVSVQEDAIAILSPDEQLDFEVVEEIDPLFTALLADPRRLNWLHQQELERPGSALDPFLRQLAAVSQRILQSAQQASSPVTPVPLPAGCVQPPGVDRLLWQVAQQNGFILRQNVFRVLLAAAAGRLHSLVILRTSAFRKGKVSSGSEFTILATFRNERPHGTVWFCDATMQPRMLEAALGEALAGLIENRPLPPRRQLVHVPHDVTLTTGGNTVRTLLRGALSLFPDRRRIGVLCHQRHKGHLQNLEPAFRDRIAMVEHFWGDADRGSNEWTCNCDLLIVLGTPRIPPEAIANLLIRLGELEAANRMGDWTVLPWTARMADGRKICVEGRGYRDQRWQAAHVATVRAALYQAIGRARTHLPDGIDAIVFSDESLGLPVLDPHLLSHLSDSVGRVFTELCALFPNRDQLGERAHPDQQKSKWQQRNPTGPAAIPTGELARRIGKSPRQTQKMLRHAEQARLVRRVSPKGGWIPDDRWRPPTESSSEAERRNLPG